MPGKQARFVALDAQNEADAQSLIGRLAAPVKIPREHDFGIDFFCQLYAEAGATSVTVDEVFTLQVKGLHETLRFGGIRDGSWRDYEIAWLKTLATPLFLARLQPTGPTLDIYSLAPLWRVLWQTPTPFEVACNTEDPSETEYKRSEPSWSPSAEPHGDGRVWTVPLGPPFVRLMHCDLETTESRATATSLLRQHVQLERRNLLLFKLRVAVHDCMEAWRTNAPWTGLHRAMFWSAKVGDNLDELAMALEPVAVNLAVHLQWQNDSAAYHFVEILQWLDQKRGLDPLGRGLLEGLQATQAAGLGPSEHEAHRA